MSNKKYTLVAWTEKGQVRMIPSLVNEAAEPYRRRIAHLESLCDEIEDEIGWLITRSRAHEAFARFLLDVGHPREAYVEYSNAAIVCTLCSDRLWINGGRCDFPEIHLFSRFLAMHRECIRLARTDRLIAISYERSELRRDYIYFIKDDVETARELDKAYESQKAWRFGKRG